MTYLGWIPRGLERGAPSVHPEGTRNRCQGAGVSTTVGTAATGSAVATRRRVARLLRLVLLGALIVVVVVGTATADSPACTHGVSSVGPVAIRLGHLSGDTNPHTEACLR